MWFFCTLTSLLQNKRGKTVREGETVRVRAESKEEQEEEEKEELYI